MIDGWRDIMTGVLVVTGMVVFVGLVCWLTADVLGIGVSVSKPQPQIIVTRQGQYECIKLINERASTCRRVTSE